MKLMFSAWKKKKYLIEFKINMYIGNILNDKINILLFNIFKKII